MGNQPPTSNTGKTDPDGGQTTGQARTYSTGIKHPYTTPGAGNYRAAAGVVPPHHAHSRGHAQQQQHGGSGAQMNMHHNNVQQGQQHPHGHVNPYRPGGGTADVINVNDNAMMDASDADLKNEIDIINMDADINISISLEDDDTVPTVFRWEHGGRQVYVTGTFNGWSKQIPMHRSGNDFTYIHNLKKGKHAFKFIVDDEWRFAPDQPTVADIEGRINNFIDVSDFKAYTGDRDFEEKANSGVVEDVGEFSHSMPDLDEYTKEPPPLPPHLRHIILNKPPQLADTAALPVPQHVALNHLYCTAIKDNMMVLGITQRYKTKFVTTVYYSPCTS